MNQVSEWHWTDWGRERSQIRAINDLDSQLASQRRAANRRLRAAESEIKSGLAKVDSRIGSVAERVDIVLEWTELRFQLLEFDEYAARKEIRKTFRAAAEGRPASMPEIADVAGYWMPPAAMAVLRLIVREDAAARGTAPRPAANAFGDLKAALERARERDPVRSELFNLTVGLTFDQPAFIDAAVLRLLAEPVDFGLAATGQVTAGWRALWEHAALGRFGQGAAAQLGDRLKTLFDPDALTEDDLAEWDRRIESFGAAEGGKADRIEAFAALGEHLAAAGEEPGGEAADDPRWRAYIQELIEEPSPAELPLVREMEDLHLPEDELRRSTPTWTEPQGTVAELVRDDLFDPEAPPALRRLALRLAEPVLRSRIERLGAGPEHTGPLTLVVKRRGIAVEVDRDGHDPDQFKAAVERLNRQVDLSGPSPRFLALTGGGFAVAAIVSLAAGNLFLAVLFALGLALPVWHYFRATSTRQVNERLRDGNVESLRKALDQAKEEVRRAERERDERAAAISAARDELLAAVEAAARA